MARETSPLVSSGSGIRILAKQSRTPAYIFSIPILSTTCPALVLSYRPACPNPSHKPQVLKCQFPRRISRAAPGNYYVGGKTRSWGAATSLTSPSSFARLGAWWTDFCVRVEYVGSPTSAVAMASNVTSRAKRENSDAVKFLFRRDCPYWKPCQCSQLIAKLRTDSPRSHFWSGQTLENYFS